MLKYLPEHTAPVSFSWDSLTCEVDVTTTRVVFVCWWVISKPIYDPASTFSLYFPVAILITYDYWTSVVV